MVSPLNNTCYMELHYHDRQNLMIKPDTAKLIKATKILVIGVGAGGNEVLKNLLLMGFGHFTILDFDTVEDSNLSRTTLFRKEDIGKSKSLVAAERLKEMALHEKPEIVGLHGNFMTDFGKGLFVEHDIVISCVDTQKCRAYINDWCVRTKTPFFEMGFEKYTVNITFFAPEGQLRQKNGEIIDNFPTHDGCFPSFLGEFPVCLREEIGYGSFDEKRNSCSGFKVKDENLEKIPTIQVSAAMAGTLIATELVKYLSGIDSIRNKMLLYSGLTYETFQVGYHRSPKCKIHNETYPLDIISIKDNPTLREMLHAVEDCYESKVLINLPDDIIVNGKCSNCGKTISYTKRASEMYDDERWCEDCKQKNLWNVNFPNSFTKIPKEISLNLEDSLLDMRINDLSIPNNDIYECLVLSGTDCLYKYVYLRVNHAD